MARGWTCTRCSNKNGEGTSYCAKCGLIRGGAVDQPTTQAVQPTWGAEEPAAAHEAAPAPELATVPEPAAPGDPGAPLQQWGDPSASTGWAVPSVGPEPPRPIWKRVPRQFLVFGLLVVVGGIVTFATDAVRLPFGDITKGGDMASHDLRVGDCWDLKDRLAESFDTVIGRPCSEEHEYELYYLEAMPAGDFPTDEAFDEFVASACIEPFGAYVGKSYRDSELEIGYFTPTAEGWGAGDRVVGCSIEDPGNWRLVGSVKGSNR